MNLKLQCKLFRMSANTPWELVLEPWGDVIKAAADSVYEVSCESEFDFEMRDPSGLKYIIYAPVKRALVVKKDGQLLENVAAVPSPPVPAGVGMKGFLKRLFG